MCRNLKTIKRIYILSTIECIKRIKNIEMNLPGLNLTNLHSHVQKMFTLSPIINQCQPIKILTSNSSTDEYKFIY